jgi:hypothetical protein
MALLIKAIFYRSITDGDFFNIERGAAAKLPSGGGQTYVDIVTSVRDDLFRFVGKALPKKGASWPPIPLKDVKVLGAPGTAHDIDFDPRSGADPRYKISNQQRQLGGSRRHPAWTSAFGFPQAPDDITGSSDPRIPNISGLRVILIRTTDDQYFATHVQSDRLPDTWPAGAGLEEMFENDRGGIIEFSPTAVKDLPPLVGEILRAWSVRPNVLLYGPPGTGKTHAMSALWRFLQEAHGKATLGLDPTNRTEPFSVLAPALDLPTPVRREWVTFHQNFSYEDFIVGLRPIPQDKGGLALKPRLGTLLDAAISLEDGGASSGKPKSVVVFVDEINRGNVSRVFGEFITFMDVAYRATTRDYKDSPERLPVPLPSVRIVAGATEPMDRLGGSEVKLNWPWYFPYHVYLLGSMNSVDRAVAPLDSALARRFTRIEVGPDVGLLANWLGVDLAALAGKAAPDLSAQDAACGLLRRLNFEMASTLGPDFEIGHTYFAELASIADANDAFRILARIWDRAIYPQLQERFTGRSEDMARILKLRADGSPPPGYLIEERQAPGGAGISDRIVLQRVTLASSDLDRIKLTLRHLAIP